MDEIKQLFPDWQTGDEIGKGSYGSVYRIQRKTHDVAEEAALKVISIPHNPEEIQELTSQGYDKQTLTAHYKDKLDELMKEYGIMLKLKGHTNIVCCDEVKWAPHDDGIGWNVYIRMELLRPLREVLRKDYREAQVIQVGRDIARALVRCRENRIIHRDIKPGNILVSREGNFKLADFGVARESEKTAAHTVAGTELYMAPEVISGEPYNQTADIYSLGLVLYWLMNNRCAPFLPQPPAIPTSSDVERAKARRYNGEPLPFPANGSVELKKIVLKACAYDPRERYQTPEELLGVLEALPLPEEGLTAGKPVKKQKKTPLVTFAALSVCVCLGLGAVLLTGSPEETTVQTVPTQSQPSLQPEESVPIMETTASTAVPEQTEPTEPAQPQPWEANLMKKDPGDQYSGVYGSQVQRSQVQTVTFLDSLSTAPMSAWDVSQAGDGSVLAWASGNGSRYDLYFAAEGGINGVYSSESLFYGYTALETVDFQGNYHTDYSESFASMFEECKALKDLDVSQLVTSRGKNFCGMFADCRSFTTLDVSSLDTRQATDMRWMFANCMGLESIIFGDFDTANVTVMNKMFQYCRNLKELDLRSFQTGKVTNMTHMFYHCDKLETIHLETFDTSAVTDMSGMFLDCPKIKDLDLQHFDTGNVVSHEFFLSSSQTVNGQPWSLLFQQNASASWEDNLLGDLYTGGIWTEAAISSVIPKYQVVSITFLDTLRDAPSTAIDISAAGNGSVLGWFSGSGQEYDMYIGGEGGVNAGTNCSWLFGHFNKLREIRFGGNFHTDYVDDMESMFGYCSMLEQVDISTLNTANVTSMNGMFAACGALTELDLRTLDTGKVKDFGGMFQFCTNLQRVDMSTWDTSSAESLSRMFYSCLRIDDLDFGNFNTKRVTDMSAMFYGCSGLQNLDIRSFDTSRVTNMEQMFAKCTRLRDLDLAHFDVSKVENHNYFAGEGVTINGQDWVNWFFFRQKGLDWEENVLKPDDTGHSLPSDGVYGSDIRRDQVHTVTFLNTCKEAPASAIDVSAAGDRSVLAWFHADGGKYELFFAGEGGINGRDACVRLFNNYTSLEEVLFQGNFHTDQTDDMTAMFSDCDSLVTLDVSSLNTGSVKSMHGMFSRCDNLKILDLSSFDTRSVTTLYHMFIGCASLERLNLSGWDTCQVSNVEKMFSGCPRLTVQDLGSLDFSRVNAYDNFLDPGVKVGEKEWSDLFPPKPWEKNVLKADTHFVDTLPVTVYGTDVPKDRVYAIAFEDSMYNVPSSAVDVSEAGDRSVMLWFSTYGTGYYMTISAEKGVNARNAQGLFAGYHNLKDIYFNGNFHTDHAECMDGMFESCASLSTVDVSDWNTARVTSMDNMFMSCSSLENLDLRGLDTGKVTSFDGMFAWCGKLKKLHLSTWDTSSAESFGSMFRYCQSLEELDLGSFDTSNTYWMACMFAECSALRKLNISSFDTSNVINMEEMFYHCAANPDLSHFDVSQVEQYNNFMTQGKKVNGENWLNLFAGHS